MGEREASEPLYSMRMRLRETGKDITPVAFQYPKKCLACSAMALSHGCPGMTTSELQKTPTGEPLGLPSAGEAWAPGSLTALRAKDNC